MSRTQHILFVEHEMYKISTKIKKYPSLNANHVDGPCFVKPNRPKYRAVKRSAMQMDAFSLSLAPLSAHSLITGTATLVYTRTLGRTLFASALSLSRAFSLFLFLCIVHTHTHTHTHSYPCQCAEVHVEGAAKSPTQQT